MNNAIWRVDGRLQPRQVEHTLTDIGLSAFNSTRRKRRRVRAGSSLSGGRNLQGYGVLAAPWR